MNFGILRAFAKSGDIFFFDVNTRRMVHVTKTDQYRRRGTRCTEQRQDEEEYNRQKRSSLGFRVTDVSPVNTMSNKKQIQILIPFQIQFFPSWASANWRVMKVEKLQMK